MLNYQNAENFFEHCLSECGIKQILEDNFKLDFFSKDEKARKVIVKSLKDIQTGADAVYGRGKPNEQSGKLTFEQWERLWNGWALSRKAAFYSRAALFMLGETSFFSYFIEVLRTSHNIVFLSGANDVLQHANRVYLNGPTEELNRNKLADWWETNYSLA